MDRVHGRGSWVHGMVDHSRPLIIRSVARILWNEELFSILIWAAELKIWGLNFMKSWSNPDHQSLLGQPWLESRKGITHSNLHRQLDDERSRATRLAGGGGACELTAARQGSSPEGR
jgi:hypothetical protein